MGTVAYIPRAVTHRRCPGCNYIIPQQMIVNMQLDYNCHGCGEHKYSTFKPVDSSKSGGGQ